ncbi:MAG TPA: hypothetical protein VFN61_07930 [Acidimicrobiales bacterium]|nr:hypothetical protein [Acidimicrobiales bacterium]
MKAVDTGDRGHAARGRDWANRDRGDAVILWCVLLAALLLPMAGISVDLWRAISMQRHLATAAEDAATAGASGVDVAYYRATGCARLGPGAIMMAEQNLAEQPGLPSGIKAAVQVAADGSQVTVTLSDQLRLSLLSFIEGAKGLTVTATAASGPHETGPGGGGCR